MLAHTLINGIACFSNVELLAALAVYAIDGTFLLGGVFVFREKSLDFPYWSVYDPYGTTGCNPVKGSSILLVGVAYNYALRCLGSIAGDVIISVVPCIHFLQDIEKYIM